jgi:hypothetical protein
VGYYDDFVAAFDEVGAEHVDVALDAAEVGEEKVGDHSGGIFIGQTEIKVKTLTQSILAPSFNCRGSDEPVTPAWTRC